MNARRCLAVAIVAAFCMGCGDDSPTAPAVSPPIDRLFIFATNWPTEEVEFVLIRDAGRSTAMLFRPARNGNARIMLDSIGPGPEEPEEVGEMLASFDVWALNAPNAPGAACRTVNGQRTCNPTTNDYQLVMRVESGDEVRVQRYTRLASSTAVPSARGLADFVLEWARDRDGGTAQGLSVPGSIGQESRQRIHECESARE